MKKFLLYLSAAVLMAVGCKKNNDFEASNEEVDGFLQEIFWEQKKIPEHEVISEGTFTPEELVEAVFESRDNLSENDLKIKEEFLKRCEEQQKELEKKYPYGAASLMFDRLKFKYKTIDQNDREIELSAFMGWAVFAVGPIVIKYDQNHVMFCCPYTHTKEDECATKSNGGKEFLTMWHDNLFIMPDGQGFGENENHVQTYLNHNLHAKQYYDALVVGQYLYEKQIKGKLEKDWTLQVVGASQGAGDAIALHRYLDTEYIRLDLTNHYKTRNWALAAALCKMYGYPEGTTIIESPIRHGHKFEFSYVCCGPYSPEVTMRTYSEWKKMSYPCVIPLVIKSMLACYPIELKKYTEEDFFSTNWNNNKFDFNRIYLEKTYDSDELNDYIFKKLKVDDRKYTSPMVPLDYILSAGMLDTTSNIYNDFMACLKKQDLTSKWTPRTKTKLYYTINDQVVPYANTKKLIDFFKANGCTCKLKEDSWYDPGEELKPMGHVGCCFNYVTSRWEW